MTTSIPRHSELWQEYFVRKAGSSNVSQSEESVTLMTAYRLPHQASGSFIFVQDDILPFFFATAADSSLIYIMVPSALSVL